MFHFWRSAATVATCYEDLRADKSLKSKLCIGNPSKHLVFSGAKHIWKKASCMVTVSYKTIQMIQGGNYSL